MKSPLKEICQIGNSFFSPKKEPETHQGFVPLLFPLSYSNMFHPPHQNKFCHWRISFHFSFPGFLLLIYSLTVMLFDFLFPSLLSELFQGYNPRGLQDWLGITHLSCMRRASLNNGHDLPATNCRENGCRFEFLLVDLSSLLRVKRTVGLTKNIQFWLDPGFLDFLTGNGLNCFLRLFDQELWGIQEEWRKLPKITRWDLTGCMVGWELGMQQICCVISGISAAWV